MVGAVSTRERRFWWTVAETTPQPKLDSPKSPKSKSPMPRSISSDGLAIEIIRADALPLVGPDSGAIV